MTAAPTPMNFARDWRARSCHPRHRNASTTNCKSYQCWRPDPRNTPSPETIWTGPPPCPGACTARTSWTSNMRARCSMLTTPGSTTSRAGSSSFSPSAPSVAKFPAPSCCWWARPAWAKPASASPSPSHSGAASIASASAACVTRPRSKAIDALTSAPCPASWSRH